MLSARACALGSLSETGQQEVVNVILREWGGGGGSTFLLSALGCTSETRQQEVVNF